MEAPSTRYTKEKDRVSGSEDKVEELLEYGDIDRDNRKQTEHL